VRFYDTHHYVEPGGIRGSGIGVHAGTVEYVDGQIWRARVKAPKVLVAIMAAEAPLPYPTAPLSYDFAIPDLDFPMDMGTPIDPSTGISMQFVGKAYTPIGDNDYFAYLYLVDNPIGAIHLRAGDFIGTSWRSFAAVGITGLEDFDHGDEGGLWIGVGYPANDWLEEDAVTPGFASPSPQQFVGGPFGCDPQIIVCDAGTVATPILYELSTSGNVRGIFLQLLGTVVPEVVTPPTTIITNVYDATTGPLAGITRAAPTMTVTNIYDADLTLPTLRTDWWAVLVDADGNRVASMPDAVLGTIAETLNDITTCPVTIPIRSTAGQLIDPAQFLPDLEVQVWRGDTLWLWGPISGCQVNGDSFQLTVSDAPWHLTRRHVGELGAAFGGKPPYFHDQMVNERFEAGGIDGWSVFRTVSFGEFPGFDTPAPGAVAVDPGRTLPDGNPMVRCTASLDPLDNYQLYQDLRVYAQQDRRPITLTLSAWWYIPSGGGYAPNNQRMGLLLATLSDDIELPAGYYFPQDLDFTILDDQIPFDTLFQQECRLTLPEGLDQLVHVSVCFPQGVSYVGGIDLRGDDGLLYIESPGGIAAGLVRHAQDPAFAKSEVNLWPGSEGDPAEVVTREYQFTDHTQTYQAITGLAREGWFDWDTAYTADKRWMNFHAPKSGAYRPRARVRMNANGHGNVTAVYRDRTTGSTAVAAQTRTGGDHERATITPDTITLEEVFVADREPRDYDLAHLADERHSVAGRPEVVKVSTNPHDERFLLGVKVGDTTDVLSDSPGALAEGRYRLTGRTIDPQRDACELTFNPEAT
jgi:hypothetical protein